MQTKFQNTEKLEQSKRWKVQKVAFILQTGIRLHFRNTFKL